MDVGGIELLARFARILAVALTACGLFLIFLDIGPKPETSRLRRRLATLWRALSGLPISAVPGFVVSAAADAVDRFVVYWYEQSARNVATAGTFTLIVFIAIPIAATLNWFRGGSPALLIVLLLCVAGMAVLAALSETKFIPSAARVLAPILYFAIFLFVPGYVFLSLTDRVLIMPIGHGMLAAVLLSPLLYLLGHSAVLLGAGVCAMPVASRTATAPRHILTLFAAALPFCYLATFAALLFWHVAAPDLPVPSTWRLLATATTTGALAAALTLHLSMPPSRQPPTGSRLALRLGTGIGASVLLALALWAIAAAPTRGSNLPVLVPLIAPGAMIGLIVVAVSAKVVLAIVASKTSGALAAERPYRIAGILALLVSLALGWATLAL